MMFFTMAVGLLCFAVNYASSQPYDLKEYIADDNFDGNDNTADEYEINAVDPYNVASDRLQPIDDMMGMEQYDTFDDYIPVMPRSKRGIKSNRGNLGRKHRARVLPTRSDRISTNKQVRRGSKSKPSTKVGTRLPPRRGGEISTDKRIHRGRRPKPSYTRRRGDRISKNKGFLREREPKRRFSVDTAVDVAGGIVGTIGNAARNGAEVALANKQREQIEQQILHDKIRFQNELNNQKGQLFSPDDSTDDSNQELNGPEEEDSIPDSANQVDNTDDLKQEMYSLDQEVVT